MQLKENSPFLFCCCCLSWPVLFVSFSRSDQRSAGLLPSFQRRSRGSPRECPAEGCCTRKRAENVQSLIFRYFLNPPLLFLSQTLAQWVLLNLFVTINACEFLPASELYADVAFVCLCMCVCVYLVFSSWHWKRSFVNKMCLMPDKCSHFCMSTACHCGPANTRGQCFIWLMDLEAIS